MTASSGSINLLEQLTKLRETFYLLDYRFGGGGRVVLFCFVWPRLMACGISVPNQGLNLGHSSESAES